MVGRTCVDTNRHESSVPFAREKAKLVHSGDATINKKFKFAMAAFFLSRKKSFWQFLSSISSHNSLL